MPDAVVSRRGSEEPLDFQPSEHAIDLLKEFISSSPGVFSTRSSISSSQLPSLPVLPFAPPLALPPTTPVPTSAPSAHPPAGRVAVPSTTSLTLLDRMHSLSAQLSRALASANGVSPPLDHEEVDRTLIAAERENAKRSIPSFRVFQEQVRGVRLMDSVKRQVDAALRRMGGGEQTVIGRRWRAEHDKKGPRTGEDAKDGDDEQRQRASEAQLEQREIDGAIEAVQAALEEGHHGGLSGRQWAMEDAASTVAHLKARRDYVRQLQAYQAAAASTSAPQAFVRDRLMTACAHLNANHLVAEGRLCVLDAVAGGGGGSGNSSLASTPRMATRSPQASPQQSPLLSARSSHLLRPMASPAFSPVIITSEVEHKAATVGLPIAAPVFSLDGPTGRSPSPSITQDRARLEVIKTRPASSSLSVPAPPSHAAPPSPSGSSLVRMGGFLKKKSPSSFLIASWQRRYFRLSSSALTYHTDSAAASVALGTVPLSSIREVVERDGGSGGRFDVRVEGERVFELEGASADERHVWVVKIREQVDSWHEKSKFASVDSASAAALGRAKDDTVRGKTAAKWWKEQRTTAKASTASGGRPKAEERKAEGEGRRVLVSVGQRMERGEFEVVKEEWGMAGGVGRLLVVRDRATPIPAMLMPSSPTLTSPTASPSYEGRTTRSSSAPPPPQPPSSIVRRGDGLYTLHLVPQSTAASVLSAVSSSLSSLSHPSLLRPLLHGSSVDQRFTLYSPYSAPASTLSSHLCRLHRFPLSSIAHIALHLTLTLGYLHSESRGCPRLAPDAVHLDDRGGVVLGSPTVTLPMRDRVAIGGDVDEVEGRVESMSPEQLRLYQRLHGDGKADDAGEDERDLTVVRMVDWWRLGVLLYELATGTLPFMLKLRGYTTASSTAFPSSASSTSAARALARGRLLQVLKQNAGNAAFAVFPASTPKALQSLIVQLLTFDTEQRLGAIDDWRDVLAHPFFDLPGTDQMDLLDHPHPTPPPFIQQLIDSAAGGSSLARTRTHSAGAYYSYHYSLVLTVHHASGINSSSIPPVAGVSSHAAPTPALYVHVLVDDATRVTSTVTGSTSPVWTQSFDFPLPLKRRADADGGAESDVGERVEEDDTGEWEALTAKLEVRHQVKSGAHAKQGDVLHVCIGLSECTVGQLLSMHRHALASSSAVLTRPHSSSIAPSFTPASDALLTSALALSLLSVDGVPNGELHVEVGVREEKRIATERVEEERWEGAVRAKDLFPGLDDWDEKDGPQPPRGWEGRDRTGGKQHAGRENERFVEQLTAPTKPADKHGRVQRPDDPQATLRHKDGSVDLDLSYVTHRLIACATPRTDGHNPSHTAASLTKFLAQRHAGHYKVLRVRQRDAEGEDVGSGAERVWEVDGDVLALWQVLDVCAEVDEWLSADSRHVVVFQCADGLHHCGWLLCAALLFDHFCPDVPTAVKLLSSRRLPPNSASPISSRQLTALSYLHQVVHGEVTTALAGSRVLSVPLRMLHVRVVGLAGDAWVRVRSVGVVGWDVWDGRGIEERTEGVEGVEGAGGWTVDVGGRVCSGDVCVGVWRRSGGKEECVCEVYCHTSWVRNGYAGWRGKEVEGLWSREAAAVSLQAHVQCEAFFAQVEP